MNKLIPKKPRVIAAIIGGLLVLTGTLMMLPPSPWTLVVIGCGVLFVTFCSLFEGTNPPL